MYIQGQLKQENAVQVYRLELCDSAAYTLGLVDLQIQD